jgi:endo-1,4-beta-xylanase
MLRRGSIFFAVTFLSSSTAVLAAVPPYGKCGGLGFQGETACAEGWTCTKYNDWYSQCVGGNPNGGAPAPAPGAPSMTVVPEPSGAPIPPTNETSIIVEPTPVPEVSGSATVPADLPSTMQTLIATGTPIVAPVAVVSSKAVAAASSKPAAAASSKPAASASAAKPAPTSSNGANGVTCSLDAAFKAHGKKYIGVATDKGLLAGKSAQIIIDNFGQVTPENSMKWDATEAVQGKLTLDTANALVDWATKNKKLIRGHTTVWHSQLPTWVSSITDKTKLTEVMVSHIQKLMGAYKGKVYAWGKFTFSFGPPSLSTSSHHPHER